jgi:hypothetical protein
MLAPHDFVMLPGSVPLEERAATQHLAQLLWDMDSYITDIETALDLYEESAPRPRAPDFLKRLRRSMLASKEIVMSIYHVSCIITAIRRGLKGCPTIQASFDKAQLKEAESIFKARFPKAEEFRHAVGHSAELGATPADRELNSLPGLRVKSSLMNSMFMFTWQGELLSVEISKATCLAMRDVEQRVLAAFLPCLNTPQR